MANSSFEQFYTSFGLKTYPFSQFSSENERSEQPDLFIATSMYGPVVEGFIKGRSMIMAGDRGSGKTAIIYDFQRRIDKANQAKLTTLISDFNSVPSQPQSTDFYQLCIERISVDLFAQIATKNVSINRLTNEDRVSLCYYLVHFVPQSGKITLKRQLEKIQIPIHKRILIKFYRACRLPLNAGLNVAAQFLSQVLAAHTGAQGSVDSKISEYLPDLDLSADDQFHTKESSYQRLANLADLVMRLTGKKPVCILDKIDEDPRFVNASEEIAEFIKPVLTDTNLMTDDRFQIIVSVWVIPYNILKPEVRTQKIFCPVLDWTADDLRKAFGKRLNYFSDGEITDPSQLFAEDISSARMQYMYVLANKNPRDLWHLIDRVMQVQYRLDPDAKRITKSALLKGFDEFVSKFNFFEYYPKKSNARANSMDIYAYTRHLLKLKDSVFTKNQLDQAARTGGSTSNYCFGMENIGLIEKVGQSGGNVSFRIRDPKVIHAIKQGLEIVQSG